MIYIKVYDNSRFWGNYYTLDSVTTDSTGVFEKAIQITSPSHIVLEATSPFPLYVFPGKTYAITCDAEDYTSIVYGEQDHVNRLLFSKIAQIYYSHSTAEMLHTNDSLIAAAIAELETIKTELSDEEYRLARQILLHKQTYNHCRQAFRNQEGPEQILRYVEHVDLEDSDFLSMDVPLSNIKLNALYKKEHQEIIPWNYFESIAKSIHSSCTRNYFQASYLYNLLSDGKHIAVSTCDSMLETLKQNHADSAYVSVIEKELNIIKSLQPGALAKDFTFLDIEGNTHALSEFKGQALVIDIWATWCPPCMEEKPYFSSLASQFRNRKDIRFVSISVDDKFIQWEKYIRKEKNASDVSQFNLSKEGQDILGTDYKLQDIPSYMIIDKDGRFIMREAPQPRGGELEKVIRNIR